MIKHCNIHGDYEAQEIELFGKTLFSRCPKCEEDLEQQQQKEAKAEEHEQQLRMLSDSGIPSLFVKSTIDNYRVNCIDQEKALELCKQYISRFDAGLCADPLFFVGSYGTGKTHLAIAILKRLLFTEKIKSGYYTTTMRMIRDIRSSYHHLSKRTEQEIIDSYVIKDLLILDEIGVQNGTDNERILIYEVLNGRYEESRPTILISNFSVNEVKDYLGARVYDRLQGKNKLLAIFDWASERGRG